MWFVSFAQLQTSTGPCVRRGRSAVLVYFCLLISFHSIGRRFNSETICPLPVDVCACVAT